MKSSTLNVKTWLSMKANIEWTKDNCVWKPAL